MANASPELLIFGADSPEVWAEACAAVDAEQASPTKVADPAEDARALEVGMGLLVGVVIASLFWLVLGVIVLVAT